MGVHPDSLKAALEYIVANDVDDDALYRELAPSDVATVRRYMLRFRAIVAKVRPPDSNKSKRAWISQQNRLKGRCFELMMRSLLPNVFQTWDRIQTDTNELDILVEHGPKTSFFPALREWGTHSICECKSNRDTFSVTWVDKLAGVLEIHGARVGIVMGTRAPQTRGNGQRAIETIRMYAVRNRTIVVLDLSDVERCLNGENALRLISRRYIEIRTGTKKYRLIGD